MRENAFVVGGALLFAAGAGITAALVWLGLGWWFYNAYLGGFFAMGFGGLFIYVGRAEAQERRAQIRKDAESLGVGGPAPPSRP